jgi:hypothetical protein
VISKCRITSILADGEVLYIGSGGGEVVQFCVVASVADPEATIKALANERNKRRTRQRRSTILESTASEECGGLLTSSILSNGKENEQPSYFATRGRCKTGRSLHRSRPKTEIKQTSIYKLEFMTSQHLGTTINESITFILPIRYLDGEMYCRFTKIPHVPSRFVCKLHLSQSIDHIL